MTDPFPVAHVRLGDYQPPAAVDAPVVQVETPDGDPVWVVTDNALARSVLADARIVKDPAWAPEHWRTWRLGLEPPAAEQPSLTTVDGPEHLRLRRAHAPLFTARRLSGYADRVAEIAGELLRGLAVPAAGSAGPVVSAAGPAVSAASATGPAASAAEAVDLTADFTARFPLAVTCELLGVPAQHLDDITAACRQLSTGEPAGIGAGMAELNRLVGTALVPGTPATELRERLPASFGEDDVRYLLFGLVFAGQVTTESALGFLVAHLLGDPAYSDADPGALAQAVLQRYPPGPFTLWRFTTVDVELAGTVLPPRSPVLVAIDGNDLTFGAGAHYCIGAQLAVLELSALAQVLRTHFPRARLAVPFGDLPVLDLGIQGRRITRLPVLLS